MTAYPRHAFDVAPGSPQPTVLTPLAQFFRRVIEAVRRKPAVPDPHSGAATALLADRYPCCPCCASGCPCDPPDQHPAPCSDGCNDAVPVLGDRMLSDVRQQWNDWHDGTPPAQQAAHAQAMHAASLPYLPPTPRRPVNGRYLGTLPRRYPGATLPYVEPLIDRGPHHPPWHTSQMAVYGQAPQLVVEPELARRVIA